LVFNSHPTNDGKAKYDEAGNTVFSAQKPTINSTSYEDRASYYGAGGALAAVDFRQISSSTWKIAFDEYRYDALGRRVLVRSRRLCGGFVVECNQSYVRRTIWAGSQELYEIQMPDSTIVREYDTQIPPTRAADGNGYDPNPMYGRIAYTFGLKLDQPLTVIRLGYKNRYSETWNPFSIVPLWTVRGTADTSYFAATGAKNCNTANHCVLVAYGSQYWTPAYSRYFVPTMFQGTLLTDKADNTGQLYRRNRYYDPGTGRFTQEDPIGLAGGLNDYGFANGDPVNFSDAFGLCGSTSGEDSDGGTGTDSTKKPTKVACEYTQSTGQLSCTDEGGNTFSETGYSGISIFKNWAAAESYKDHGPIPAGTYKIGKAQPDKNYHGKGPVVMRLTPDAGNNMFGRTDFLVHGDNGRGTASIGCVVMSRKTREKMAAGGTLVVKH
jgi:RHS repeat-associated protein